jgi:hypothetical protein
LKKKPGLSGGEAKGALSVLRITADCSPCLIERHLLENVRIQFPGHFYAKRIIE